MKSPLLEVCIASVDDALIAVANGAGRLELNSALELGGLTPSIGVLQEVRRCVKVPVIAMVRPRPAGFCYSACEFRVMSRDARALLDAGADGLAFGVLTADGAIDLERNARLLSLCAGRQSVFHRAFDLVPDPLAALDRLIELGFTRIMTSGQERIAIDGVPLIARLIRHAAGRIEVLPAAGISVENAKMIIEQTGCSQIHASLRGTRIDPAIPTNTKVRFHTTKPIPEDQLASTDGERVAGLVASLVGL